MGLTLREAKNSDIQSVVAMGARFHAKTVYGAMGPLDIETVVNRVHALVNGAGVVFIVSDGERDVGMIGAYLTAPWFNAQIKIALELFWWVEEDARSSGAGKMLMEALEEWWPSRAKSLYMTRTPNIKPRAMDRFYLSKGFMPWDQLYVRISGYNDLSVPHETLGGG